MGEETRQAASDQAAEEGNPALPTRLRDMRTYFNRMRERFGEEATAEMRRSYLTGIDHASKGTCELGAFMQYALDGD